MVTLWFHEKHNMKVSSQIVDRNDRTSRGMRQASCLACLIFVIIHKSIDHAEILSILKLAFRTRPKRCFLLVPWVGVWSVILTVPWLYSFVVFCFMENLFFTKPKNSRWVWSGNTTITNCRQPRGTASKSRPTITRHQEDKLSKAISSLFPIKMIAILEWT